LVIFFKYTDSLRIALLFIVLLLLRIPFLYLGFPLTLPELEWLTVGEKLANGFMLYRDLWVRLEPFSAYTYFILVSVFGKSVIALRICSLLLVYLQAIYFNYLCNRLSLYNEKSTYPALFYIVFSTLFIDFLSLPPVLLALTFLLFAFHSCILQIKFKPSNTGILYLGVFLAIATLFYQPILVFIPIFIFSMLLFTTLNFRRFVLMFIGFSIPYLFFILYYFIFDSLDKLIDILPTGLDMFSSINYISISSIFPILILPIIVILASLIEIASRSNYINFQYSIFKFMLLGLLAALGTVFLSDTFSAFNFFIFVPFIAYFSSHFFLLNKKSLFLKISFWVIIVLTPGLTAFYRFYESGKYIDALIVKNTEKTYPINLKNKKLLLLGTDPAAYYNARLATPYYQWELAKYRFSTLNSMESLSEIYKDFNKDMPEVIIDQKGIIPQVFYRIPLLEKKYRKLEEHPVYILENQN
jgi:hypothetical protein